MLRLLICAFLLYTVNGELIQDVLCDLDSVNPVTNINISRILGEWRQLKRIHNALDSGDCSSLIIESHDSGTSNTTNIRAALTHREVVENVEKYRHGEIVSTDTYKFRMEYHNISFNSVIAATDYSKYAIIYSCNDNADNKSAVVVWVYSRSDTLQQVEQDTNYQTAYNAITILQNATWIVPRYDSEACKVNSATAYKVSPIAVLAMFIISMVSFIVN